MRCLPTLLYAPGLLLPLVYASNVFSESNKLKCADASVHSVPAQMVGASGTMSPHQLLYSIREVLCTKACGRPNNLPDGVAWSTGSKTAGDCEISVAIQGNVEAYFYRGTPSTGDQWQQCLDSTDQIIKQCGKVGPNRGWVNGPQKYQFYEGGFRPLNGQGSFHAPMRADGLKSAAAVGSVAPNKQSGVTCGSGTGGTRVADCLQILGSIVNGQTLDSKDKSEKFCTSDSSCLTHGNTGSSDGSNVLYGSYCEITAVQGCSLVLATKMSSQGGFPGKSCVSAAQISDFIRQGANTCGANNADGVWAASYKPGDQVVNQPFTVLAMVAQGSTGAVYVP